MASYSFREARQDDAGVLAELVNLAGEGMPLQLWETMREPGETAWDVARRRAARDDGGISWRNAVIAEVDGEIAGALIGYPRPPMPEPVDYAAMPSMFTPLQELETLAPNTWYVNILAVFPAFRGRGLGARLMTMAEDIAAREGKPGLSVIVSDASTNAKQLYLTCGYRQAAMRPKAWDAGHIEGESWILLTKGL